MISELNAYAYCIEDISLIENYDEAKKSQINWECHHKLEIELHKSAKELIEMGFYFHRPASELIFLTKKEHLILHNSGKNHPFYGKTLSNETKCKMSESHKGEKNINFNKTLTEETKRKISESKKGCIPWNKGLKGKHRVYDNIEHTKYHYE